MMVSVLCETAAFAALLFASSAASRKTTNPSRVPKHAVLLSKVASLTLRNGKMTSSRRVAPLPQLECVGPKDVCKLYKVDTMRCTNEGADYDAENIQWSCKAALPEEFKLGGTEVVCEGYESSEDPYVLKGSCAVEYRLLLTDKGEAKYVGSGKPFPGWTSEGDDTSETQGSTNLPGAVFMVAFAIVLFIILRGIWTQSRRNPPRLGGGLRPNGNGGDDDPPPPYDGPPSYTSSPRKQSTRTSTTQASSSRSQTNSTRAAGAAQQGAWRPGFWTGAAAGAAAGAYAASRPQNRPPSQQTQPQMQEQPTSSWFGSTRQEARGDSRPSSSFSTPSFSTERHESTGFGGTRRR